MHAFRVFLKSIFFSLITFNVLFSTDWNGGATGNWSIPGNWNPAIIPNAVGAEANFPDVGTNVATTLTVDINVGTLSSANVGVGTNLVTIDGNQTLTINTDVTLESGAQIVLTDMANVVFADNATVTLNGSAGNTAFAINETDIDATTLNIVGPGTCTSV